MDDVQEWGMGLDQLLAGPVQRIDSFLLQSPPISSQPTTVALLPSYKVLKEDSARQTS